MKGSHVFRSKISMVSLVLVANRSHEMASVNLVDRVRMWHCYCKTKHYYNVVLCLPGHAVIA